jgi:pfkB family carbohydrate kinase
MNGETKYESTKESSGSPITGQARNLMSGGGVRVVPAPRLLLIGDVMTDVIVRPEGALAKGTDRRARICFEPGGSAANQAAWLASFGVNVDFVARVGLAEVESEIPTP